MGRKRSSPNGSNHPFPAIPLVAVEPYLVILVVLSGVMAAAGVMVVDVPMLVLLSWTVFLLVMADPVRRVSSWRGIPAVMTALAGVALALLLPIPIGAREAVLATVSTGVVWLVLRITGTRGIPLSWRLRIGG